MRLKIVYIVGDGRSGSTVLESVISNSNQTISVGECYRFWELFYKNRILCGCGLKIGECQFWQSVSNDLEGSLANYDPQKIKLLIKKIQGFKNFNRLSLKNPDVQNLLPIVKAFYISILKNSGDKVIIDSSKSPAWGKLISLITDFDVRYIHLERSLPYVASSWKKSVMHPAFFNDKIFLPVKSNFDIIRTWIRVKLQAHSLSKFHYLYVRYNDLCDNPSTLTNIKALIDFDFKNQLMFFNHALVGNPVRFASSSGLKLINNDRGKPRNIDFMAFLLFYFIDVICCLFLGKLVQNKSVVIVT